MDRDVPMALAESSLFDRLTTRDAASTDHPPRFVVDAVSASPDQGSAKISRRERLRQMAVIRGQIRRDLLLLMGTRRLPVDADVQRWPQVEQSVLNFGIPDVTGVTSSGIDLNKFSAEIRRVVQRYEPRLHRKSVEVTSRLGEPPTRDLQVCIEGLFGPPDAIESFRLGVSICLNTGQCVAMELS